MNLTPEQVEANKDAIKASNDRTLLQYSEWMQTNAASHMMRAARQCGITGLLQKHQHTLDELCDSLGLERETTSLLLSGLVAIGFVEQYEDDFTLARAGHLLCQYDQDLGDQRWEMLKERLDPQAKPSTETAAAMRDTMADQIAATQWIHTAAAMQAAEILDLGGEDSTSGTRMLDLGCGSAVWSCAMSHRDATSTVVAVDNHARLQAASSTATSIGLGDRFQTIESDVLSVTLAEGEFDLVIVAQQLSLYSDADASAILDMAAKALSDGGRIVAPDLYLGPGRPGLTEASGRLAIHLGTADGRVRDLRTMDQMFKAAGLGSIQFTYLAASSEGMGMVVGQKESSAEA